MIQATIFLLTSMQRDTLGICLPGSQNKSARSVGVCKARFINQVDKKKPNPLRDRFLRSLDVSSPTVTIANNSQWLVICFIFNLWPHSACSRKAEIFSLLFNLVYSPRIPRSGSSACNLFSIGRDWSLFGPCWDPWRVVSLTDWCKVRSVPWIDQRTKINLTFIIWWEGGQVQLNPLQKVTGAVSWLWTSTWLNTSLPPPPPPLRSFIWNSLYNYLQNPYSCMKMELKII